MLAAGATSGVMDMKKQSERKLQRQNRWQEIVREQRLAEKVSGEKGEKVGEKVSGTVVFAVFHTDMVPDTFYSSTNNARHTSR
jgi:hypothetical protein